MGFSSVRLQIMTLELKNNASILIIVYVFSYMKVKLFLGFNNKVWKALISLILKKFPFDDNRLILKNYLSTTNLKGLKIPVDSKQK